MEKILEMRKKLQALILQMRECQGVENPDMTKIENISAEVRALANQIETEEAIARLNGEADPFTRGSGNTPPASKEEETRAAVIHFMRTGDAAELRAMTSGITGNGDTGGYLIPQEWENAILEREKELFVMRSLADVQQSTHDRNIPVADDYGESGWIDEGGAYPESDANFLPEEMKAFKLGRICKVSEELLQDNTYNLEQWLINVFSYTNGLAMEKSFINGNGIKKPRGFLLDAQGVAASNASITYKDILKVFAALKSGYFANANWIMNGNTLVEVMLLQDASGRYLYQPFSNLGSSNAPLGAILNRPVVISSLMPDIGAGNKPIAFGDFKRYRIHDRLGFKIQRLDEIYAANGFIGFRGKQRTDGKLLIEEAVQSLNFAGASGG